MPSGDSVNPVPGRSYLYGLLHIIRGARPHVRELRRRRLLGVW